MASENLRHGIEQLYLRKGRSGLLETEQSLQRLLGSEAVPRQKKAQAELMIGLIYSKLNNIGKSLEILNRFIATYGDCAEERKFAEQQIAELNKQQPRPEPTLPEPEPVSPKSEPPASDAHPVALGSKGFLSEKRLHTEETLVERLRQPLINVAAVILIAALGYGIYHLTLENRRQEESAKALAPATVLKYRSGLADQPYVLISRETTILYEKPNAKSTARATLRKRSLLPLQTVVNDEWISVEYRGGAGYLRAADTIRPGIRFDLFNDPYLAGELLDAFMEFNRIAGAELFRVYDYSDKDDGFRLYSAAWNTTEPALLEPETRDRVIDTMGSILQRLRKSSGGKIKYLAVYNFSGEELLKL